MWVVDVSSRILSVDVFQNIDPRHLVPLRPIKLSAWLEIFFGKDIVLYHEHPCLKDTGVPRMNLKGNVQKCQQSCIYLTSGCCFWSMSMRGTRLLCWYGIMISSISFRRT